MNQATNDSKAQEQQKSENRMRANRGMDTNHDGNFDKKLDGPNRPAE